MMMIPPRALSIFQKPIVGKALSLAMSNRAVFAGVIIVCAALNTWYLYRDELLLFSDSSQNVLTRSPEVPMNLKIAIVSVLDVSSSRTKYSTAMASMECYALRQNYTYLVANGANYRNDCKHKDITFQRHCIVAILLSSFDWILFVDADIGVVNENV
ncbi:unnamed protein product [Heligmosomoides polygyrus]|uniref:Nucleotid_trans domain-containing protein n=1 Tax=Heligmosomoides polygyrus TaxID=6339 RepID=A0A183F9E3_HELPZ|nr:unnamed protein product [Heligmosomoides polygyrus]